MTTVTAQIAYLDGPRLRRSLLAACDYAEGQRAELNRINVFPVPDGDTGTNLALTLRSIADHLRSSRARPVSEVAHEAAQGAVLGARGNCGMMLSHFLLGFAEHVGSHERITTADFGLAMSAGVERLHGALEEPVEGTILTVMRDAAVAAREFRETDFVPLVAHVVERARISLAATPDLLPVLREAGVVDAGAKGFVSLLEGVLRFVRGLPIEATRSSNGAGDAPVVRVEFANDEEQYRYCTEALVRGDDLPSQNEVRDVLSREGDSVIVIRSGDVLKIHLHTDEPEQVFSYLRGLGSLVTRKAEDMRVQYETIGKAGAGRHIRLARRPIAVVTDSACDLSEEVVRAHGIQVIPMTLVDGDRTYRDRFDISAERFHEMLATASTLPTTSQPSPAAISEALERAAEEGEEVVVVMTASTLSGAYRAAQAAVAPMQASVRVVDSLGASLLQGLLVLKAAELGEGGRSADEIVAELERIRGRSNILFTVRTFERLIASGRVGKGKALLGRMLGLKPVLGLTVEGRVTAYGKAFGDERARPELLRVLRSQIPEGASRVRFGVVHVGVPELVEPISEALRSEYGSDVEILSAPATPVISTHLGIGAWGVAYIVED